MSRPHSWKGLALPKVHSLNFKLFPTATKAIALSNAGTAEGESMSYIPSQDQVTAQLRILIPTLATAATAFGVSQTDAGSYAQWAMASIAPISYVIVAIWTAVANTRAAIMAKAAKSVAPGVPAPTITLPKEETALADKLPSNVTAAK
jgi:hypothetical protein